MARNGTWLSESAVIEQDRHGSIITCRTNAKLTCIVDVLTNEFLANCFHLRYQL